MLSKIHSLTTVGIEARQIEIEVDTSGGLPTFVIVGLPDTTIRESRDRVKTAIKNSQFQYPSGHITVNLAPCDIKKEGPSFDLPIAIGILCATCQINIEHIKEFVFLGELALNGKIRPIKGALPIAMSLKNSNKKLVLPEENAKEVSIVEGVKIYPVNSLGKVCKFLNGHIPLKPVSKIPHKYFEEEVGDLDFSDVKGQRLAKRAMEIAASGGHNIIMIGPPGSGKTMLAKRLPTILPYMTLEESLETMKIHSIAGLINPKNSILKTRPFRTPHHTSSSVALVGGGSGLKPGEVSIAHNGVLFMDELPEFHRDVLEALRQPLEDGYVTIARASGTLKFPSKFMLVCAMNPCPCGFLTDPKKVCQCTPPKIQKYLSKISGPLLDRIDIHIEIPSVKYKELSDEKAAESSRDVKERIQNARSLQLQRFREDGIFSNAQMGYRLVRKYCKLDEGGRSILKKAITELGFSARCYDKILKVSRTIADLEKKPNIEPDHVSEAVQYRTLDRTTTWY